ncbi:MAG: ribose 5-phosphate isomerase B [Sphaerochaetaceae bacterium]
MKVIVANDHAAIELTLMLIEHMRHRGIEVTHLGVATLESVDYPDMAQAACQAFLDEGYDLGLLCCGTGIGISISANKIDGIRCALPQNTYAAKMAKAHNDANFIAFGGRVEYADSPVAMLDAFLDTPFEAGRHTKRVDKIMALEHLKR